MPACCPEQFHLTPSGAANEIHGAALVLHVEALMADMPIEKNTENWSQGAIAVGPRVQAVT